MSSLVFVAALFENQPVLVDLTDDEPVVQTLPSAPRRPPTERDADLEKQAAQDAKQTTTVARFSPSGEHIFAGTNKGWLNIIDAATRTTLSSSRISSSMIILVRFTDAGRDLVVNSSDRIIRTFRLPDFSAPGFDLDAFRLDTPLRFQDLVNRLSWNHVCFSPSGEHVVASPYMNHSVYIWDRDHDRGSLVKILEAPDEISVVEWHPHRPCLAAVGLDEGRIYVWATVTPQRWSALAPDFVEVEENVEYVEREDEFDIAPPEELQRRRIVREEDERVDVLTLDPAPRAARFRLPVVLDEPGAGNSDSEDDVVAVGAGQFRRKTPGREWGAGGADGDAPSTAGASGDERAKANGTKANGSRRRGKAD
jgi:COMPASS component SWD1